MKVKYQGKETETGADTVAAFLVAQGVDAAEAVVELDGEIIRTSPPHGNEYIYNPNDYRMVYMDFTRL